MYSKNIVGSLYVYAMETQWESFAIRAVLSGGKYMLRICSGRTWEISQF
jgi:hypothetical protein